METGRRQAGGRQEAGRRQAGGRKEAGRRQAGDRNEAGMRQEGGRQTGRGQADREGAGRQEDRSRRCRWYHKLLPSLYGLSRFWQLGWFEWRELAMVMCVIRRHWGWAAVGDRGGCCAA